MSIIIESFLNAIKPAKVIFDFIMKPGFPNSTLAQTSKFHHNTNINFANPKELHLMGKENQMDTKVALIGIVVSDLNAAQKLNELLHEYGEYIIGRMGLPYKKENISLVSVAIDAPLDKINALTGKLGAVDGINAKTIFPNK